jgi:hypothetical protein
LIEEPHLGRLMEKIRGPVKPAIERLEFSHPASSDPEHRAQSSANSDQSHS